MIELKKEFTSSLTGYYRFYWTEHGETLSACAFLKVGEVFKFGDDATNPLGGCYLQP